MNDTGCHEANNEPAAEPLARRPGRRKGMPRPPGAGRKKGTPNKVTRDVREAASKYGGKALRRLVQLMQSEDVRVALGAAREILDRAYGRPITPSEVTGKDGAPLLPSREAEAMTDIDLARLVTFQLTRASRAVDELARQSPNVTPIRKGTPDAA